MSRSAPLRAGAAWTLFAAWAATVWLLSASSDPRRDLSIPWEIPDKVSHGAEFGAGGFLARASFSTVVEGAAAPALVACAVWGCVDEIHQGFVPGRATDPWDLAADVTGAALGVLFHFAVARRRGGMARTSR